MGYSKKITYLCSGRKEIIATKTQVMRTIKISRHRAVRSMTVARHPFFEGLRSLGSLGGDNSLFNDYLRGDNASDLRRDWDTVNSDIRKVFNSQRKQLYAR